MTFSSALIEWESGGLEDVPTKNILILLNAITQELLLRSEQVDAILREKSNQPDFEAADDWNKDKQP